MTDIDIIFRDLAIKEVEYWTEIYKREKQKGNERYARFILEDKNSNLNQAKKYLYDKFLIEFDENKLKEKQTPCSRQQFLLWEIKQ